MKNFCSEQEETGRIIKSSTVYCSMVLRNGRKFVDRYTGECKDLVEKRAESARSSIDKMASPSVSKPYEIKGGWAVDLTWWSTD